ATAIATAWRWHAPRGIATSTLPTGSSASTITPSNSAPARRTVRPGRSVTGPCASRRARPEHGGGSDPHEHTPRAPVSIPELHGVPSATGVNWHPRAASHESVVHSFPSTQTSGVPMWQTPVRQTSLPLHTVASAQEVLSGTLVYEQTPVAASHASTVQGF